MLPANTGRTASPRTPPGEDLAGSAEPVYRSERTVVRRRRAADGRRLVVKQALGPSAADRIAAEAQILRRLGAVPGVPALLGGDGGDGGDRGDGATSLLLQDCGDRCLADLIEFGPRDPHQVLALMVSLAETLTAVHAAGVVHRDINPRNVVIDGEMAPHLVDFDLATADGQARPGFVDSGTMLGHLAYLAPEQTGRTGWPVDQRSDLYGLGATAYALAAGVPPFGDSDPVTLVRDILVRQPAPLTDGVPGIPRALSDVVARLLQKEPDRRYQSARGLLFDLRRLAADPGADFTIGRWDFPARLQPPARLVGRDPDLRRLERALGEAVQGRFSAVLVAGEPGVGKSVLIEQLRPLVTARGGWFVAGKADQFAHDPGSNVFARAADGVGDLLLGLPKLQLDPIRDRLRRDLGDNAGLVTAILPAFEHLIGVPAQVADGDPLENERRLVGCAPALFRAIAGRDRPVVIMLDDLQWADPSALTVIDTMLTEQVPGVLLIGGYRSAEVDAAHPLTAMIRRWERLGVAPRRIDLAPLPSADLTDLLVKVLRLEPEDAARLAIEIARRSHGNPYETLELLNALYAEGVLRLGDDGWEWDDAQLRDVVDARDVVQVLQARIQRLPEPAREALQVMACLGREVGRDLLAVGCGVDQDGLTEGLAPAVAQGLLVVDGADGPQGADGGDPAAGTCVRFGHDRIQQAAHDVLDDDARAGLQLSLARRLARAERTAEAAAQYLAVHASVTDPAELAGVVTLFRTAAHRARLISNHLWVERYVTAARAAQQALSDVLSNVDGSNVDGNEADGNGVRGSDADGDQVLAELDVELHAALYALARPQEADEVFERIRARTDDPVELAAAACTQISNLTNRGHIPQTLALGLDLIDRLGVGAPGDDVMAEVAAGFARTATWLRTTCLADDLAAPATTEPAMLAAAGLIARMCPPAFFSDHALLGWLVTRAQQLWEQHGPQPALVPALGHCNAFELGCVTDHDLDRAVLERVLAVGEARWETACTSAAHFLHAVLIGHWHQPLEAVAAESRQAREGLLHSGDLQTACFAYYPGVIALTECATTVEELAAEADAALALAARTGNDQAAENFLAFRQLTRALRGRTRAVGSFTDDTFDEDAHVATCTPANPMALVYFHLEHAVCAAVFGQRGRLSAHLEALPPIIEVVGGTYATALVRHLQALELADRIRTGPAEAASSLVTQFDAHHAFIAESAAGAPHNFRHLDLWLTAERAWAVGDRDGATDAFDHALRAADQVNRPWHQGVLAEHAGQFHAELGHGHHATLLRTLARDRYAAWGATAKAADLDRCHPDLLPRVPALTGDAAGFGQHPHGQHPYGQHSTSVTDDAIDALAILRASQALASHRDLDQLRAALTVQVQALTGATGVRLALFDTETGQWRLPPDEAHRAWRVLRPQDSCELALSAFRYAERTGEPLLVRDAVTDGRFAADPYLRDLDQCALMVLPISGHAGRRAMLVLENRLSRSAFTPARLDAVTMLAGQLAVSLDNALSERFRALVQRASEATVVVGRDHTVTYASTPTAALVGRDRDDLTGRGIHDFFDPADHPDLDRHLADAEAATWQARIRHTDGTLRWVEATLTDLREDPAVGSLVLRLQDISTRRRLEVELRHAQKMESVGQLAAGVAHEINTPIQFVGDNLRFVEEAAAGLARLIHAYRDPGSSEDPSQVAVAIDVDYLLEDLPEALRHTREGVERVARIVRAMKTSVHPGTETKTPADLNEIIRNTLVITNNQIKYVADVHLDLAEDLPQVWCHSGDLGQVLLNLVINATHAITETLHGGRARGTLTIRSRATGSDVTIEVQDDGCGIPPDIADRVFEQFFTTKTVGAGTGQGLALAYYLIHDRHQGSIHFTSTPGAGSTFTITLPIQPPENPAA